MKKVLFFLIILSVNISLSQEMLSPLMYNQNIKSSQNASRNIDNLYIYAKDTIHLPFKDDFSKDYFKKYNASPTDTNVRDTMHYAIYLSGIPDVDTAAYMEDTTYRYNITVFPGDSLGYDTINQPSITITHCDLSVHPVVCQTKTVWPATTIIDSLHTGISPDGIYPISPADITQDSATVYFVDVVDSSSLWVDNYVYRNNNYQVNPPTIGVATFDGLNDAGYPYDFSSSFSYGEADYLTSKPINLKQDQSGNPYGIADSLYLSFYYQAQGLGNQPEVEDSLVLQFWSPGDSSWNSIWSAPGEGLDSNFKRVMIPIKENKYLDNGFQFRFLNYASLSGSFDHWNVDYVQLDANRFIGDTNLQDASFVNPVNTLLNSYTAMPWKHYKWDVNGFMKDSIITQQKNLDNVGHLMGDYNLEVFYKNTLLTTINNPNTPSINAFTPFETEFQIGSNSFFYDTMVNDTAAIFNVAIRHTTTPDLCRNNDTIYLNQEFSDYYAYDDGSAEAAYGVQGVGGILPKIAAKFNLIQGDTLKSIKIHFSPSAYDRSSTPIIITVWKEGSGGRPGTIIHENLTFSNPVYNIGLNGFHEYSLDSGLYIPAGNYFVGWQQTTSDIINVGYDLNIDNDPNSFYNSTGVWSQSGFGGSFMIRPAFAYAKDYIVSIEEEKTDKPELVLYPNPTTDFIFIKSSLAQLKYQIFTINGKFVESGIYQNGINLVNYENGFYFIQLSDGTHQYFKKIIKN